MDREEVTRLLQGGSELVYRFRPISLPNGGELQRLLSLRLLAIDAPDYYPPRVLQEEPTYVFKQKLARTRPFEVSFWENIKGLEDLYGGAIFHLEFHLANLDEVDEFLVQFGLIVCDFSEFTF